MSNNLSLAQEFAWSLATSLMACVTLFRSEGGYAVVPTAEFDGDLEIAIGGRSGRGPEINRREHHGDHRHLHPHQRQQLHRRGQDTQHQRQDHD